jgi:UDP-sugar transporter A1/2/3
MLVQPYEVDDEEDVSLLVEGEVPEHAAEASKVPEHAAEASETPKIFGIPIAYFSFVCFVFQNVTAVLLQRYCRSVPSEKNFLSSTAVISSEVVKFSICAILEFKTAGSLASTYAKPAELARTSVPALLYLLQNNLVYYAFGKLDAATYAVLYQSKILLVAVFSVPILGKQLMPTQWLALMLLTAGVIIVQRSGEQPPSQDNSNPDLQVEQKLLGLIAVLAAAACSSLAGVYFELMLKGVQLSLWARNFQLSGYSILIGIFGLMVTSDMDLVMQQGYFYGYTHNTVLIVVINAVGGLLVAVVIKYLDNIIKNFANTFSTILACVFSAMFMDFKVTFEFFVGVVVVLSSVMLYNTKDPKAAFGCGRGV